MGPQSRNNVEKMIEKAHRTKEAYATIELTLELYLDNKKLLAGSKDDLAIGVSNIMNTNITDTGIIALAKSLNGHKRSSFLILVAEHEFDGEDIRRKRTNALSDDCKPWMEIFRRIKKEGLGIHEIDKQIIEYEIANLYLDTITDGEKGFIKQIKLELAW